MASHVNYGTETDGRQPATWRSDSCDYRMILQLLLLVIVHTGFGSRHCDYGFQENTFYLESYRSDSFTHRIYFRLKTHVKAGQRFVLRTSAQSRLMKLMVALYMYLSCGYRRCTSCVDGSLYIFHVFTSFPLIRSRWFARG